MCLKTILLSFIFAISSSIIIAQNGVTITEPPKAPYYFSDNHPPSYYDGNAHLPVIFTNSPRYDPVNDMVWLKNDKIKIGINLKRGGQIAWASKTNAATNLIYNGYDGGFQVTLDAYQKKDGYTQNGKVSHSAPNNEGPETSYNVTQGGDFSNHAVSLIDYHAIPNGYYVKMRPIFYTLDSEHSETFLEAKYTIISNSVKIEYRYTSFRTDSQWDGGGFDGAAVPSCFIVNTLNKYRTYTGDSPWTNAPTNGGDLPNETAGQRSVEAHGTEFWGMVYDANHPESGIGVYNATDATKSQYFQFKQKEVYRGNGQGTEFNGGYTYFHSFLDFNISNRGNYVKDITCYLMIGSETEIRNRAIEIYRGSPICQNVPNSPTNANANPATVSSGGQAILNANCSTGNVVWGNGNSIVNPTVTTTYTVKCISGSCESSQGSVTVNVSSPPSPTPTPTPTPSGSHCPYQDAQGWHYWSQGENKFKAGNYFAWDAPNNRILYALKGSQGLYASINPNQGGYILNQQELRSAGVPEDIISCFAGGTVSNPCQNAPNSPTNTSANPATVSSGGQAILNANCSTGNVVWGNGNSIVNPTVTTTYTVKCILGSCESSQGSVTVTVSSPPSPTLTLTPTSSGSHCPYQDAQGWHHWSQGENKFKVGNYFAFDAPNNRILYALKGSQGLYASINPNQGGYILNQQELRSAGVPEDIISCFTDGRARIGVTSFEKSNIMNVYPNPTDGKINVAFYLENDENVLMNLYNFQGKSMDSKNINAHEGSNILELDLKNYSVGTYFINLQSSEKHEVQKIIKVN